MHQRVRLEHRLERGQRLQIAGDDAASPQVAPLRAKLVGEYRDGVSSDTLESALRRRDQRLRLRERRLLAGVEDRPSAKIRRQIDAALRDDLAAGNGDHCRPSGMRLEPQRGAHRD